MLQKRNNVDIIKQNGNLIQNFIVAIVTNEDILIIFKQEILNRKFPPQRSNH